VKTEAKHFVGVSKMVDRGLRQKPEQTIATNVAGILSA
jgi:hypothetical protein